MTARARSRPGIFGRAGLRTALAALCLAALWLGELSGHRPFTLSADVALLRRTAGADPDRARASGIGFAFDPGYEAFLAAVRAATPPDAVVALRHPLRNELYTYQAWSLLAPRRIVEPERREEAGYFASYREALPGSTPIANGSIARLR